mmetsp:Transcript_92964/g.240163  ORF Transcript_92964/g.240163 Transcript_92964/m.240163 type:complete len:239 (+) Transcript_92964:754-1470(+)
MGGEGIGIELKTLRGSWPGQSRVTLHGLREAAHAGCNGLPIQRPQHPIRTKQLQHAEAFGFHATPGSCMEGADDIFQAPPLEDLLHTGHGLRQELAVAPAAGQRPVLDDHHGLRRLRTSAFVNDHQRHRPQELHGLFACAKTSLEELVDIGKDFRLGHGLAAHVKPLHGFAQHRGAAAACHANGEDGPQLRGFGQRLCEGCRGLPGQSEDLLHIFPLADEHEWRVRRPEARRMSHQED